MKVVRDQGLGDREKINVATDSLTTIRRKKHFVFFPSMLGKCSGIFRRNYYLLTTCMGVIR